MNALTRGWMAVPAALSAKRVPVRLNGGVASLVIEGAAGTLLAGPASRLERLGVRATLCLDGLDGASCDAAAMTALRDQGHELGLLAPPGLEGFADATARARAALVDATGVRAASLAWRDDRSSARLKAQAARAFAVICGRRAGVNQGAVDLADLACASLHGGKVKALAGRAVRRSGWLVLRVAVTEATEASLADALDGIAAAGLDVLPLKHAAARAVFGS